MFSISGLKDFLSILGSCAIISLIFFTLLCSAAPAKLVEDREVLSWLEDWTEKLGKSAQETFRKYVSSACAGYVIDRELVSNVLSKWFFFLVLLNVLAGSSQVQQPQK